MLPVASITSYEQSQGLVFGHCASSDFFSDISSRLLQLSRDFFEIPTEIPESAYKGHTDPEDRKDFREIYIDDMFFLYLQAICEEFGVNETQISLDANIGGKTLNRGICLAIFMVGNQEETPNKLFNLYGASKFTPEQILEFDELQNNMGFIIKEVQLYELIQTLIYQKEMTPFGFMSWFKIYDSYFIITEFVGADLNQQVDEFSLKQKRKMQYSIACKFEELIASGIIPGDAKSENTAIQEFGQNPVFIDFSVCLFSEALLEKYQNLFARFNVTGDYLVNNATLSTTYTTFDEVETDKFMDSEFDFAQKFGYFSELFVLVIFGILDANVTPVIEDKLCKYFRYSSRSQTKRFDFFWTILFGVPTKYPVDYSNFDQLSQEFLDCLAQTENPDNDNDNEAEEIRANEFEEADECEEADEDEEDDDDNEAEEIKADEYEEDQNDDQDEDEDDGEDEDEDDKNSHKISLLQKFYTNQRLRQIIAKMSEVIKTQNNSIISGFDLCPDAVAFAN